MTYFEKKPAVLMLEDGTIYYGKSAGKIGIATGEICFNTGMTGYQEIFTDPSYFGQLLVTTNAHIGNYGTHVQEIESDSIKIAGLICKNFTNIFSRQSVTQSIQDYFLNENIVSISDVDTRAIVRHIRDKGAMNAIISSEEHDINKLKTILKDVPSMEGLELVSKVSAKKEYFIGNTSSKYKVAVIDLGVKKNILNSLLERDCCLQVFPHDTPFEEIKKHQFDGYFLSNGPGDPAVLTQVVKTVKDILNDNAPFFGICLGHQILALAAGVSTYKMHHGHRGINHPVKNLISGCCEITSQNHGFGINKQEVEKNKNIEITHINLNDESVEGIRLLHKNAFSVQFHPESSPGTHDSRYLFDDFLKNMQKVKSSTVKI